MQRIKLSHSSKKWPCRAYSSSVHTGKLINYQLTQRAKKRKRKILFEIPFLLKTSIKLSLTYWKIQTYILKTQDNILSSVFSYQRLQDYYMKVKIKVNVFPIMLHSTSSFYHNFQQLPARLWGQIMFSVLLTNVEQSYSISDC